MFAPSPMKKDVKAAIAAVAVTRSRCIMPTHSIYSSFLSHTGSSCVGVQTQVPPDCDVMFAFTYIFAR